MADMTPDLRHHGPHATWALYVDFRVGHVGLQATPVCGKTMSTPLPG